MYALMTDIYAFIKPELDAHTLGVNSAAELLKLCGYKVIIADNLIENAISELNNASKRKSIINWILKNKINRIGISYRLDENDGVKMVRFLIEELKNNKMLDFQGGPIKSIYFGGLPQTCDLVESEFNGLVTTFIGGEHASKTLYKMHVPKEKIPKDIKEGSMYDKFLLDFGKSVIDSQEYLKFKAIDRSSYEEYGTSDDSVIKRIDSNNKNTFYPLIRAHVGPYSSTEDRFSQVEKFISWSAELAKSNYLDILSIGSSQLTQSNFGEDWKDKTNGGGVPINSSEEYNMIWEASRPMLVRTYAGTKNIPQLAQIHEDSLYICWHALSLWWFNKLDERGPYDLYTSLKQHIETIKYIAATDKPFEANVSHHFAFRGADDVTYIVSAFLAAKLAKKLGIKTFILQNMLNTPKLTWGIQDLAKSRAMIKLIRELECPDFRVILQPRAGLDYFKPDLYEAKIQLSAISALMDDIEPHNEDSPQIIHVVSYSEASHLADPDIINESIKITQYSLQKYRELRKNGKIEDMSKNSDVQERMSELINSAQTIIAGIEQNINDPYSAEGFYEIFAAGFLPAPYLWGEAEEFKYAKAWKTKPIKGSIKIIDENNNIVKSEQLVEIAVQNIGEVESNLNRRIFQ